MKKKLVQAHVPETCHLAAMETEIFKDMLSVVEHLAVCKYEDGDRRQTGTIMLKTNGTAFQALVKDPDTGMCFTACGKTLDEALETAALYLATESAPWEVDPYAKRQAGRKKKSS